MPHPRNEEQLAALLKNHAAELPVSAALRDDVLASAPGSMQRLDAMMRDARGLPVSRGLAKRILAAAPGGGLWKSIWPFGSVWRPATGLAAMALFGVMLGASDAANLRGEVSIGGALSEEVFSLVFSASDARVPEEIEWPE